MATHDYVIANGSGSAVRQDINGAFAAIATNNADTTPGPTTTYQYQWWADKTSGLMKLRNGDNDAWVSLFNLDGSSLGPGKVTFGATEVVFNDAGNDVDFRIEGDTEANLFFVDASTDRVGLGTSSPGTVFNIRTDASDDGILLEKNDGTDVARLFFDATSSDARLDMFSGGTAKIQLRANGDSHISGGNVGIGTTSPGEELQIGSTTSASSTSPVTLSLGGQYTPQASISLSNLKLKVYDGSTDSAGFTAGQEGLSYVCGKLQSHVWYRADGAGTLSESMRIRTDGTVATAGGFGIGNVSQAMANSFYIASTAIGIGAGNSTLKYNTSSGLVSYDTSSALVKENIIDCPYGIDAIKQLQPRKYFRVDDQREEIGFVADEVVNVLPEYVPVGPKSVITKDESDTEEIPLGVHYDKLTAVLTKALQEAIAKIETLEAKVAALEAS